MLVSPESQVPDTVSEPEFVFELFITGATPNSTRAVRNLKEICELHLTNRYVLRVVDIYQQPELARAQQIIAAPTLLRVAPLPRRQIIGDLSARDKVLDALGLPELP